MTLPNLAGDVQGLTSNVYLLRGEHAALVDAGSQFDLVQRIEELDLDRPPTRVLITHTHPDHVDNLDDLRDRFDVETLGVDAESHYVDRGLDDGESVRLGDERFDVLHTPGHAGDHLCAFSPTSGTLISGDLVFANGGIGRVDLPGADPAALKRSIERVHDATNRALAAIHPGHGPAVEGDARRHLEAARRAAQSL